MTSSEQIPLRETPGSLRLEIARKLLKAQQGFLRHLGHQFAANASISILLHCFISDSDEQACNIDIVVGEYGTSATTTWRWIVALQDNGLVHVSRQGRTASLSLTNRGLERVRAILDDAEIQP